MPEAGILTLDGFAAPPERANQPKDVPDRVEQTSS